MSFRQITAVALLALASITSAAELPPQGVQVPAEPPALGPDTVAGCFSSLGDMKLETSYQFNSQSYCATQCRKKGKLMGASQAKNCFCGDKIPFHGTLLNDTQCNQPCPGFGEQACGGLKAYTVYNIGIQISVEEAEDDSPKPSTTSTTATASPTTTGTKGASNVAETTPTSSPEPDKDKKESGPNTVGIAVGVVVGVLAIGGIVALCFFMVRRKRNAELEEEHRRNAAVNAFISGGKPPGSSGGSMSIADSRMDPILNRRLSDGSIADNQDYTRRILRVTNV